ncbi:hypothetical protein DSCO28_29380 [Desulfosarcina ovata subsp. sediminis]|uniref:protein-glutamate methylesterase n=1 Tax=Desulfosarcina ovata subsp. sediminis TaxID=885957 RepID=A0A5K7ZJP4_9BACT|nr:chemotaxis protein CheB [Desulfosarcina ovata]BBO82372.1 hypothetical protein DSCO28_29380 [Desulfosarcina ovata subsp. sediminis]
MNRVMLSRPTDMAETIDRLPPTVIPAAACRAVVIGGSAGGIDALTIILSKLPEDFQRPVLVVQHLHPSDNGAFARHLETKTQPKNIILNAIVGEWGAQERDVKHRVQANDRETENSDRR